MNISAGTASALADALLILHFGIVFFIAAGFLFIIAGAIFKWGWTRNALFRYLHLGLMIFIAFQALFGRICSLTLLEHHLRTAAGEGGYEKAFLAHYAERLLYYDLPASFFTALYGAAALFALLLVRLWPPESLHK